MNRTISSTEARIRFGEVMRHAQDGPIIVERDGQPQVVIISNCVDASLAAKRLLFPDANAVQKTWDAWEAKADNLALAERLSAPFFTADRRVYNHLNSQKTVQTQIVVLED